MLGKKGKLSALFSVAGLILIACFYYFQITATAWVIVIFVGEILIAIGIIFSVLSFIKREKGFWKYSPFIVLWIYFLGIFLSIILIAMIGEP
ncbi:hypothetical protein ACIQXW_09110 [Lysinibacillus sp. NPDC097162]|uniref:hypothetical protein n=1 Tax=Lysinibacillus sp. NPDC097162 TaxID=3364140 RepID=UPI00380A29AE